MHLSSVFSTDWHTAVRQWTSTDHPRRAVDTALPLPSVPSMLRETGRALQVYRDLWGDAAGWGSGLSGLEWTKWKVTATDLLNPTIVPITPDKPPLDLVPESPLPTPWLLALTPWL